MVEFVSSGGKAWTVVTDSELQVDGADGIVHEGEAPIAIYDDDDDDMSHSDKIVA